MSMAAKILIRKRVLIETVNDELKNIAQLEHSRHRLFNNFVANALSAIAAYCFFEKKPAIDINFINDGQLNLFWLYQKLTLMIKWYTEIFIIKKMYRQNFNSLAVLRREVIQAKKCTPLQDTLSVIVKALAYNNVVKVHK